MCKHVENAQVAIRSPCCRRWFDCAQCHAETESHPLLKRMELVFACKKCKKCFRKDASEMEECDEYCPHCDNHFLLNQVVPQAELRIETEDPRKDSRVLRDERVQQEGARSIFDVRDADNRLG